MKKFLFMIFIISLTSVLKSQNQPAILDSLIFNDPVESRKIFFGIDPAASDTLDYSLMEANLPPFPPSPALETRFIMPYNNFSGEKGSYRDFRNGTIPYTGQKEHRIKVQSHGSLQMVYNLPSGITITLQDLFGGVILNANLSGSGTQALPDALDQFKLLINYSNVATDVNDEDVSLSGYNLSQNYPNPFNPSTKIQYTLQGADKLVTLKVFDVLGREVRNLVNANQSAGNYEVFFNAAGLTSGIYFYKLNAGEFSKTKSMILMK